jgi:hypothetical protein
MKPRVEWTEFTWLLMTCVLVIFYCTHRDTPLPPPPSKTEGCWTFFSSSQKKKGGEVGGNSPAKNLSLLLKVLNKKLSLHLKSCFFDGGRNPL